MSMFDGINDPTIKTQRNSEFIRPGRYLCRLDKIKTGKQRPPKSGEFTVFEFTVLDVVDELPAADNPKGPHRVGDIVAWVVMRRWDSFLSTIKTAIVALTDCSEQEVTPENLLTIVGDVQPLAGTFCEVEAKEVKKRDGSPFTRLRIIRRLDEGEAAARVPPHVAEAFDLQKT